MTKIATFVKRLIRRVRQMGAQILFAFGGACFPLGLYWEIEYPEAPALWFTFIILGAIFWVGAVLFANKKEKQERLDRTAQMEELRKQGQKLDGLSTELRELLGNIHMELQKLNQNKG
jgi:type VI protein secretion system component VasK